MDADDIDFISGGKVVWLYRSCAVANRFQEPQTLISIMALNNPRLWMSMGKYFVRHPGFIARASSL